MTSMIKFEEKKNQKIFHRKNNEKFSKFSHMYKNFHRYILTHTFKQTHVWIFEVRME